MSGDKLPREVRERLSAAGLEAATIQSGDTFFRLRVTAGSEVCLVDLVAEPVPPIAAPQRLTLQDAPRKDAGFSPLTLAWVLRDIRPKTLGHLSGLSEEESKDLDDFKERLVLELLETGAPQ